MDLLGNDYPYSSTALSGKHVLVCGASKGIGAATAKMMAKAGADVTVSARSHDDLVHLCEELTQLGSGQHAPLVLDLEDTSSIQPAIQILVEQRGPIHILVNNAGGPPGGPLLSNSVEDFEAPFKRHLHAAHTLTQILAPAMEEVGFGRIIQIISTSVKEPIPNIGLSNTLRGAMASWAKSLSRELAPCITINNVLPGFTDTGRLGSLASSIHQRTGKSIEDVHEGWMSQVPINRLIDPLETASAITFLALPASGGIRGVSLAVDGGRLRSI
ncbi:MAG: SDR family oxidoreductase [Euryarchaeota archaeon TMED99]|nr:MAG: SDR family oxidoreductase [Euryarchaeota archaeon TMED99]|tara:strand:+ start:1048 stop:1863 length:816 start_codon:yes stop_codon:yes gene_type:complete